MPQLDDNLCYLKAAFDAVCDDAKKAGCWYVALFEARPYYGGPEEGGWWGTDRILVAYRMYESEEAAENAKEAIEVMAADLTADERKRDGDLCLRQMDWLDDRGLDADFLPENDGPSEFFVAVTEGMPESAYGGRHYE